MDARETIGRAVAKVKGECWHEWRQLTRTHSIYRCDSCGLQTGRPHHPDYTFEAYIRQAVRVLCDTEERRLRFCDRFEIEVASALKNESALAQSFDFDCYTAPAEVLVAALLPIAEEVLKEESDE